MILLIQPIFDNSIRRQNLVLLYRSFVEHEKSAKRYLHQIGHKVYAVKHFSYRSRVKENELGLYVFCKQRSVNFRIPRPGRSVARTKTYGRHPIILYHYKTL